MNSVLLYLMATQTALAQDVAGLSLQRLLDLEVTVASRSSETLAQAPSSVTTFTADDLRRMGIRTLEDLLNFVPGYQVTLDTEQGTAWRIGARGRSTALSESILVLIDNQRLNDLYSGGISILNRDLAIENIETVQVIRGPGSALYGANAFLGVIDIKTTRDRTNVGVIAHSSVGVTGYGNASIKQGPVTAALFARGHVDNGVVMSGIADAFGTVTDLRINRQDIDLAAQLHVAGFSASLRHSERNRSGYLTFGSASEANDEHMDQTNARLSWTVETERADLSIAVAGTRDRWDTLALLIPAELEFTPGFALDNDFIGGPYLTSLGGSGAIDARLRLFPDNELVGGVLFERYGITDVVNQNTHHPLTLEYQGGAIARFDGDESFNRIVARNVGGAYLQDQHHFGDLIVTAGARLDTYDDIGTSLNPRAAVVYTSSFGGTFKAMYGSAFRSPNFLELYDQYNPVDFGNPELGPEKVHTVEASWVQKVPGAQWSVTGFNNVISNIIQLGDPVDDPLNPFGAQSFANNDNNLTQGVEVEMLTSPTWGMFIRAGYTHLFAKDSPMAADSGFLSATFDRWPLVLNANVVVRGAVPVLVNQGPTVIVGGRVGYRPASELEIFVLGQNLLNQQFLTTSALLPSGVPNPGISLHGGVTWTPRLGLQGP